VEKVHQLDGFTLAQSLVINTFRLVIKLESNREDFHMFCKVALAINVSAKDQSCNPRKNISAFDDAAGSLGGVGSLASALKLKNALRKSSAS
jgi:hypothetical protein